MHMLFETLSTQICRRSSSATCLPTSLPKAWLSVSKSMCMHYHLCPRTPSTATSRVPTAERLNTTDRHDETENAEGNPGQSHGPTGCSSTNGPSISTPGGESETRRETSSSRAKVAEASCW